jgi:hypothetical protein
MIEAFEITVAVAGVWCLSSRLLEIYRDGF